MSQGGLSTHGGDPAEDHAVDPGHEPDPRGVRQARRHVKGPVSLPVPARARGLRGRVQRLINAIEQRAERSGLRRNRWPRDIVRLVVHVVRQWARDRCPQHAAMLAFQTSLSIAPMLAVAMAALRVSGNVDAESAFVQFIARELIPVSREAIAQQLATWSANTNLQSQGIIGLITTALLAFITVNSIERTINQVWRAEHRRSLAQKFMVFYATGTLGPLLIGTSLYQAAKFGLTDGWSGFFLSFATSFGALFLANYFLPALRVSIRAAAAGALVSALLFDTAKYAFNVFVTEYAFARYSGIYGAMAVVPLWLLWVYYSWLTFLLGVEVAHAVQNLRLLQRSDRRRALSLENEIIQRVNGMTAARIMLAICSAYAAGDKVLPRRTLQDMFDLSEEVLSRIVERLARGDLVIEVEGEQSGLLPARPPSEIALHDVLGAFRADDTLPAPPVAAGGPSQLDRVLAEIESQTHQRTAGLYFDQLI